jgi:hypothetical protein
LFEVSEQNTDFNPNLYNITWTNLELKEGNTTDGTYLLKLSKASKKYECIVYPVFEGKSLEEAQKTYSKKLEEYSALLQKRKTDEDKMMEDYKAKIAAMKKQQDELQIKWRLEQEEQFANSNAQQKVYRMFVINSFGVYNSDACRVLPGDIVVAADLQNEKGISLYAPQVYLVTKGKNALYTLRRNPLKTLTFRTQSENMIWTYENGVIYWLKPEDFKNIKQSDGVIKIKLHRVDKEFANSEELKKYFGI